MHKAIKVRLYPNDKQA
ncbi:MAG: helix-turn-helix domain-containing protein, partial [Cyanobacteria bacterium]|nr:helix-turn-helix domain-containing protein [Cyanobacteria bacterium CG_2015-16_32_12]